MPTCTLGLKCKVRSVLSEIVFSLAEQYTINDLGGGQGKNRKLIYFSIRKPLGFFLETALQCFSQFSRPLHIITGHPLMLHQQRFPLTTNYNTVLLW